MKYIFLLLTLWAQCARSSDLGEFSKKSFPRSLGGLSFSRAQGECVFDQEFPKAFTKANSLYTVLGAKLSFSHYTLIGVGSLCFYSETIEHPLYKTNLATANRASNSSLYCFIHPLQYIAPFRKIGKHIGIGAGIELDHFCLSAKGETNYNDSRGRVGIVSALSVGDNFLTCILSVSPYSLAKGIKINIKKLLNLEYEVEQAELNIYTLKVVGNILNFK